MSIDSMDVELSDGFSLFDVELHDFVFCTFTLTAEMWTIIPNDVEKLHVFNGITIKLDMCKVLEKDQMMRFEPDWSEKREFLDKVLGVSGIII
eukprot:13131057-Ditylum_brightwellii.AAC.1